MLAQLPGTEVEPGGVGLKGFATLSFSGNERDPLFVNDGHGHFEDLGNPAGIDLPGDGRSQAWADLDGDGDLDLVVRQIGNPRIVVFRNDSAATRHWLEVDLVGTKSNRMGLGAKVRACAKSGCQVRELHAGRGYLAQGPATAHFGLGATTAVDLEIAWPSGAVQRFENVAADRQLRITEGSDQLAPLARTAVALGAPNPPTLDMRALAAAGGAGPLRAAAASGKPVLVNLWAPWCKPCQEEAPVLDGAPAEVLRVALEMDPGKPDAKPPSLMHWPIARGTPEQKALLEHALQGGELPTTLAFDAQGKLVRAVIGKLSPAALAKLAASAAPPPARPR